MQVEEGGVSRVSFNLDGGLPNVVQILTVSVPPCPATGRMERLVCPVARDVNILV